MNLDRHPDLLEHLAAAYALGTLRGGARRRFETLARSRPALLLAVRSWEARFASLTEMQTDVLPDENVWKRIRLELDRQRERESSDARRAQPAAAPRRRWSWPFVLPTAAAVAAIGVGTLLALRLADADRLRQVLAADNARLAAQVAAAPPSISYVATLAGQRGDAQALVTWDRAGGAITLRRVGDFREPDDRSLQLWALPAGGAPRSLGVLDGPGVLRLAAADPSLADVPTLAISLEPKGGVPSAGGPTGPVLFTGAWVRVS